MKRHSRKKTKVGFSSLFSRQITHKSIQLLTHLIRNLQCFSLSWNNNQIPYWDLRSPAGPSCTLLNDFPPLIMTLKSLWFSLGFSNTPHAPFDLGAFFLHAVLSVWNLPSFSSFQSHRKSLRNLSRSSKQRLNPSGKYSLNAPYFFIVDLYQLYLQSCLPPVLGCEFKACLPHHCIIAPTTVSRICKC